MATKVKENDEAEIEREGGTDGPLARPFRRCRQEDDQGRQEARLCDHGRAECGAAVGRSDLGADRGHDVDALRHGHQCRRGRRGRRQLRFFRRRQFRGRERIDRDGDLERHRGRRRRKRRSRPTAPTIRCACICARWVRSSCLSREGEIAIAKRIEAGRETMIAGLCESPLTFQAIIIWRDELNEGKILLREIIDLETTYAGPEAEQAAAAVPDARGDRGRPQGRRGKGACAQGAAPPTTTSPMSAAKARPSRTTTTTRTRPTCRLPRWRPS